MLARTHLCKLRECFTPSSFTRRFHAPSYIVIPTFECELLNVCYQFSYNRRRAPVLVLRPKISSITLKPLNDMHRCGLCISIHLKVEHSRHSTYRHLRKCLANYNSVCNNRVFSVSSHSNAFVQTAMLLLGRS